MSASAARRALRLASGLLALACVAWVAWRFVEEGAWRTVLASGYAPALAGATALAALVYAAALCLLALAWWCIQCAFSDARPPLRAYVALYATTQLGKYLPGNVGQYVGRHLLARHHGAGDAGLLAGALVEALWLVGAACAWAGAALHALPALPAWPRALAPHGESWALPIGIAAALAAALSVAVWALRRRPALARRVPLLHARWLAPAWGLHLAFFAGMGACLALVAAPLLPASPTAGGIGLPLLVSVAAASWVAGYLAVGAPAGIGVREAVLLAMLGDALPDARWLAVVAAFRVATFGGDVLLFSIGAAMGGLRSPGAHARPASLG